jgi:hypothetical protein
MAFTLASASGPMQLSVLVTGLLSSSLKARRNWGKAHLVVDLTLGSAEVSGQDHLGAFANQVMDRWQCCTDAGVVCNRTGVVQRHVEVDPHKNAFAAQVAAIQFCQGTLRHVVMS